MSGHKVMPRESEMELIPVPLDGESGVEGKLREVESGGTAGDQDVQPDVMEVKKKPRKRWKKAKEEEEGQDEKSEKQPRPSPAQVYKLFRYATWLDVIIMVIGALAAIAHGAALPSVMLLFGDVTDAFINQEASASYVQPGNSNEIDCAAGVVNDSNSSISFTMARERYLNEVATGDVDCSASAYGVTLTDVLESCYSEIVDCTSDSEFFDTINMQCIIFACIGVGAFIAAYFQISLFQLACERQVHKMNLLFYRAILRQNIGWFDANPSGELSSRMSDDIEKIRAGLGDKLAILIQWMSTFVTGFVIGFVKDYRLTLLIVAFTPFIAISGAMMAKLTAKFASQEQKEYASAGAVAEEVLSSIRTVVAFGGEYKEVDRYDTQLKMARKVGAKKGFSVGITLGSIFLFIFSLYAVAFWFSGYLIQEEELQGGDVLTVFFAVLIGAFSLGQAAPNIENLLTAAGAAGAIFDTIDRDPPIDSFTSQGLVPDKWESSIEFKDVSFNYPTRPDVPVLTNVSLEVKVGQTVALVGASGCGKSTVVQLLQRFYDIDRGEVLVGGMDVRTLNLKWLRSNIGLVSQEPILFDTTIAENIRYGREDATMDDIIEAAKKANAHDFISELPAGYDTLVGEGGTQMSGGQKQRIAIARALVRDPKILLLDEATSALDTESESVVQAALDHAREGRTTIVIAHRLSTIQQADVIASIHEGQVVEVGTHAELMDKKGVYCDLVTAQSYGTDEAFVQGGGRLFAGRKRQASESGVQRQVSFQPQVSVQRQTSKAPEPAGKPQLKKQISERKQEEWDKDLPSVSLLRVVKVNAPEWWIIVIGILAAGVNGLIFPSFALLFGEILKVFAKPADEVLDAIHPWAALYVVLGIVSGTAIFLKSVCFSISGEALTARLRSRSFKAMLRQEIGWFDEERNSTGALSTRLAGDAAAVQGATGIRLGTLIETAFGLLLAIAIAFAFSWVLTLVILGVVPLLLFAGALQVKVLTGHAAKNKKALEKAGKIAVDSIENIRTVTALGVQESFYQQYVGEVAVPYRKSLVNTVVYGLTYAFSQALIFFMYATIFRFGAYQVTVGSSNVAHAEFYDVFRVFTALIFGALHIGQAGAFAPNYAKAKLSTNRIFSLLDREPVIDNYSEKGAKPTVTRGELEVQVVNFSYPARPDVQVLQGLTVGVSPGQTLALVGPSGCGKSTVVSLIERFYDPSSGSLWLDRVDLPDLNVRWLRSQVGIVSQEPVLFDTSIAENIRYGANFREVSDEEVIEAAKAANIHTFIESLPQGYGTNVGAKGTQLSGGQKQRIAIARALVRDPKILLLDEATSALDTESEKIVQEALDKARKGRTSIVIAHRLSTIYGADCIAVIQGGKVVEKGTHSELLAAKGIYYKLNRFQLMATEEGRETEI